MSRRFTHGGRIDSRDRGPFVTGVIAVPFPEATFTRLWVRQNIAASQEARSASRFLDPDNDDALSLTVGWVRDVWSSHAEAADADAGFDGGEFSGPAHDRLAHSEVAFLKRHYFEFAGVPFDREVVARVGLEVAMKLDVLTLGNDD